MISGCLYTDFAPNCRSPPFHFLQNFVYRILHGNVVGNTTLRHYLCMSLLQFWLLLQGTFLKQAITGSDACTNFFPYWEMHCSKYVSDYVLCNVYFKQNVLYARSLRLYLKSLSFFSDPPYQLKCNIRFPISWLVQANKTQEVIFSVL